MFSFLLSACQQNGKHEISWANENLTKVAHQDLPSSKEDISIKTEKEDYTVTDKELTIRLENEGDTEIIYGLRFSIQKKIEGVWFDYPLKNPLFTDEGHYLIPHKVESQTISLNNDLTVYELTTGEYRIVKTFSDSYIAAPFEIIE
ncbi:immunoglobulin-like domain-containing protein [Bacillus sp. 37MA]|uniref:immunoglobulin-like domain-containing protein n=1 Tax=Bacillus sp. 37MA TaxID=1132442 RepID=UPI00037D8075|nr:immunoglobulin-like domain-containing protein [Bacillus sp. 37MA]